MPAPFPVDPYDGSLPVITLNASNQVYLVEDTPEDYATFQANQTPGMNLSLGANPISADEGSPAPQFDTSQLYVKSITLSGSTLQFDVRNLVLGDDYLICRKKSLDDNFTNYWVPEWIFTAPAVNIGLSIPMPTDSDDGFYRFVNYSQYQGPDLTITAPVDNSTNSGTIQVKCLLTDIFQPVAVELYIDGALYKKVYSGQISFDVDTTKIGNGSHIFTVVLSSRIPYGTNAFEASASTYLGNVITSNAFAAVNMPQASTASLGSIPYQFQSTEPVICSLVIADTNNLPLRTLWATNDAAGTFEIDWDLTKDNGSPVDVPGTYLITATANPKPGSNCQVQPNFPPPPWILPSKLTIHSGLHAGYTSAFRAELKDMGDDTRQETLINYVCGGVTAACTVHPYDGDGYPRFMDPDATPKIFRSDGDLQSFFAITTNMNRYTGHIVWVGHASSSSFGAGLNGDTVITAVIGEYDIRNAYGNGYNPATGEYWFGVGGKRGRVRYTEIDGCSSAGRGGDMCVAFGTPINFNGNPNLEKSTYCGWRDLIYLQGNWPFFGTPESRHVQMLQAYWSGLGIDTPTISAASLEAFYDAGDDSYVPLFVIQGSGGLKWQN